ncbi:hypothetical protein FACS1894103_0050 [Campylobacterota bacterium]|nr:hypothetical protein FACS1894103_0050 [Campylobacterota bacterium]
MASLLIRKLDENVKCRLRENAVRNKRSMEEEARAIIATSVSEPAKSTSAQFRDLFADCQMEDFETPPRNDLPRIAKL